MARECAAKGKEKGHGEAGPDGLELQTSAESSTGYLSIKKIRGLYYAKVTVEPWPAPQRTLPGKGFKTAREAAIHRARYLAARYPLPAKRGQRPRGKGKVEMSSWRGRRGRRRRRSATSGHPGADRRA